MNLKLRLQLSVMMFVQFFIWGAWFVTAPNYLGTIGFNANDIGWTYAVGPIAAMISPFFVGMMYPAYLRGQAHLLARNGKEAAVEFQRIISHRGIVLNFPLAAVAHLGLARAHALEGDTANARVAYEDFLKLWKGADSDIPLFQEAKTEYARLR